MLGLPGWRAWLFGILCVGTLSWVVLPLKPFQDCVRERQDYQPYKPLSKEEFFFIQSARLQVRLALACSVHAADTYQGAVVALSGVVVAFFTFTLWLSTQRLWKAGERQAGITKTMADATVLAQRARIEIIPSWTTDGPRENYRWGDSPQAPQFRFYTTMHNVGQLPATNLGNTIGFNFIEGELPDDFAFPAEDVAPLARTGVLGKLRPIHGPHVPVNGYVTAGEIERMQREEVRFYFFGWVNYRDGFPNTPRRTTRFCYWVMVTGNPDMPVMFISDHKYNSAD